jgi:hypothetical protein
MANLFSKDRLMEYGALGLGAATASIVTDKLVPQVGKMISPTKPLPPIVGQLTPLAVGILLPTLIKGTAVRNIGDGMIAVSVGGIVSGLLKKAGIGDVLMGDVLMGAMDDNTPFGADSTLMGAASDGFGFNEFSSTSGDSTAAFAGEMDF